MWSVAIVRCTVGGATRKELLEVALRWRPAVQDRFGVIHARYCLERRGKGIDVRRSAIRGLAEDRDALPLHHRQAVDPCTGGAVRRFPPAEPRRTCSRLAFHYVPEHASWLDMVGIEIGILGPMQRSADPDQSTVTPKSTRPGARCAARARGRWRLGIEQANINPGAPTGRSPPTSVT